MIQKYSTLKQAEWYSNPILNGISIPEEGSKKASSNKQSDEFFIQQANESSEKATQEIIKEFSSKKAVGAKDPKNPNNYLWIISKDITNPKELRVTFFDAGEPTSHATEEFSKKGILKLIEENNLTISFMRKDIPDWAKMGNVEPIKTYYRLKYREPSPKTVPLGFIETRGPRVIVYDRLLSSKEISDFELEPLGYEDSHTKFKG